MSADRVVAAARAWLGTPYRHRAATLGAGCDCLGLVAGVWRMLYGSEPPELPPYRADWRDVSFAPELEVLAERWLVPEAELATGRVVLFRIGVSPLPRHCAVMVGPARFVHAQERLGVVEGNLTDGWRRRVAGVFGFPGVGAAADRGVAVRLNPSPLLRDGTGKCQFLLRCPPRKGEGGPAHSAR